MRVFFVVVAMLLPTVTYGQQPDPAKVLQAVQAQREGYANAAAQCSAFASDLQVRIAELEKQLAELKKEK